MNCPSKTDPEIPNDWNQSPNDLAADTTTRSDLGRLASARTKHDHKLRKQDGATIELRQVTGPSEADGATRRRRKSDGAVSARSIAPSGFGEQMLELTLGQSHSNPGSPNPMLPAWQRPFRRSGQVMWKFMKFIGPGFMVAVVSGNASRRSWREH